jgi:hypothetical protein
MAATAVSNIYTTLLKTLYSNGAIDDLVLPKSPLLGLMPKKEDFVGYDYHVLLEYGDILGVGHGFAGALAAVAGTSDVKFALTRTKTYAIAQITGEAIEASRGGDKAAFVAVLKRQMDSALSAIGQTLSHGIYRNTYGSRGIISSITNANPAVITLTNIDDIVNFAVGMNLTVCGTDGGTMRAGNEAITLIDRDLGTITMTSNVTSDHSWAAADYIYRNSDVDAVGSGGAVANAAANCAGLASWLPSSAPGATSFFGVDRSVDTSRLGGIRYDGSSKNIAEALTGALYRAGRDGVFPDHIFMNFAALGQLNDLLGAKVQYCDAQAFNNAQVGFKGITIMGPGGPVKCFGDQFCPTNVAYALTLKSWCLHSLNKLPHILDLDNANILRLASQDSYEVRWGGYYQLGCNAPGRNVRIALA